MGSHDDDAKQRKKAKRASEGEIELEPDTRTPKKSKQTNLIIEEGKSAGMRYCKTNEKTRNEIIYASTYITSQRWFAF
jgi:hypothetical protein